MTKFLQDILSVTMILFAVIDIVGSIPVIIAIRNRTGHIHPVQATFVALIIMIGFLFLGEGILKLLGVDVSSFAIAGSLVIFFIALEMLLGIRLFRDEMPKSAAIVPVAFPLIAGTGTMTTLLSLRSQYTTDAILIGIVVNLLVVFLVLRYVHVFERILGEVGMAVLRKVFGVVLLAIAIKLFRINLGMFSAH